MFKEIDPVPNLPELENKIIQRWEKDGIPEKLKQLRKDAEERVYYDGPITANNMPHYGHVIAWTLKDLIPRYWSMKGFFVERNMGWDCQGLPVEFEVQKELGIEQKEQVVDYGIEKFNQKCKESVFRYRDQIYSYEKRIGRWFDENHTYYTMDKDYIESIWWSLKELYKKGYLYEGLKVVPYSTGGACALSHHEVTEGGYKEVEDPAITVKFQLVDEPNTYFLAWTTTPWTIPGNLLLGIGKNIKYVKVKLAGENYILAKKRLNEIFGNRKYEILETLTGKELQNIEYNPPFDHFEQKRSEGCFKTVIAHHATDEDGTGIVHLAPYGEEDFDIFMEMGIELFDYLDEYVHFNELIPWIKGKSYKDANPIINEKLKEKGLMFEETTCIHRVPICWRTKTVLIYKPIDSWYIAVSKVKDKMLKENARIHWIPEHIKEGMSYQWLSNARDWSISRSRFWGTPLPIWINDTTGEKYFAGSFGEIEELSGMKIEDPHLPYINKITWKDQNGGTFRRISDLLDVWYDSGAMPFARLHYPFENKEKLDKRIKFPAQYIAEGLDQVRLWFYTMHILGVMLFNEIPYENVVVNGMMQDRHGNKLSKSKRNFPPMDEVLGILGADILRLFILNSPIVHGESARFYKEALDDVKKNFFLPLWNSLRYFVIFANINIWKPEFEKTNASSRTPKYPASENALDKWILARLKEVINNVEENMKLYKFAFAAREFPSFVQDLSTWYIRRSRDRIRDGDKDALETTYYILATFSKLIAPFVPFISEEVYEILSVTNGTGLDSVHYDFYPEAQNLTNEEKEILNKMETTRDIVSLGLAIRDTEGVKVRQPLRTLSVLTKKKGPELEKNFYDDLIKDEVNVKEVKFIKNELENEKFAENDTFKVYLDLKLDDELLAEGRLRDLIRKIQSQRKKMGLSAGDKINVVLEESAENKELIKKFSIELTTGVNAKEVVLSEEFRIDKTI